MNPAIALRTRRSRIRSTGKIKPKSLVNLVIPKRLKTGIQRLAAALVRPRIKERVFLDNQLDRLLGGTSDDDEGYIATVRTVTNLRLDKTGSS
jgi:hypothetical protein